ncbi:Beta-barrel assembly machine subunit BamB [Sphaerotilus hippei]|uniref:Outer membrane protein assembly factor BamB n=1 Tax=Sphaerotilus hippei TaxID=744406 RepID=A0A318H4A0_9BURK|nr:outer membrane protein assembly factor BamB [Sphaerotilus hippei]PXW98632.1 Beta-barrel assembly machine subunit BamB [Sphaerotilus hippei]
MTARRLSLAGSRAASAWSCAGVLAAMLLGACSSDRPAPSPLTAFEPRLSAQPAWKKDIGTPAAELSVVAFRDRFVLASRSGTVSTLDALTGDVMSRVDTGVRLGAAVGADGTHVAVVSQDNELVVADRTQVRWRVRLPARVVTAPLVAGERVFVQAVDRSVEAYDVLDGRKLWVYSRAGDPLALAHPGVLMAFKDTLLVGSSARLMALDPLTGTVRNEMVVGQPRGTNEVERLADLAGPAARVGDSVCARSFQVAVTCLLPDRGSLLWTRPLGGFQGVGADSDYVVAADASDRISAWKRNAGDVAWSTERLRHRGLSAPLVISQAVVFGDAEGWLHFLSRDKGETLQRFPTDGGAIVTAPVQAGPMVLVVTRKGGVFAFRAR